MKELWKIISFEDTTKAGILLSLKIWCEIILISWVTQIVIWTLINLIT